MSVSSRLRVTSHSQNGSSRTDPGNLPMRGVMVTARSPVALQPAGFERQTQTIGVAMAETLGMKITLALAGVTETLSVTPLVGFAAAARFLALTTAANVTK